MFSAFNTFGRMGAAAGSKSLAQQIAAMSPSLWLEPSVTNGYQDSAGTTALYQPGTGSADPPVGKVIDLSGNGNHAIQATSTARPKLSGRVNEFLASENLSDSAWFVQAGASKTNATTFAANAQYGTLRQGLWGKTPGITYEYSVEVAAVSGNTNLWLTQEGVTTTVSPITVTSTPQRFTFSGVVDASGFLTFGVQDRNASGQGTIYVSKASAAKGTSVPYQSVTDASTYATAGFPLIHQFDAVDDVYTSTFGSSLGSSCTVVTANRGAAPTILTGQTIGTSLAINATHAGKLVFNRALTAAETAIVTTWATQKGALPA